MDAYALALKFQTEGFDDVFRKLDQVDQKGRRTAETGTRTGLSIERIGHKAANVATALAGMETVGVSAMEKIAHGATNIGFMFGPQGAIVAAAGIAAVAIVNIFTQARKEMEATDKRARDLLRSLSLDTGVKTLSTLYGGDQFAKAGSPEAMGLAAARRRQAELQAQVKPLEFGRGPEGDVIVAPRSAAQKKLADELETVNDWLKENEVLYTRVTKRVNELAAAEVERNQNLIKIAEDEKHQHDEEILGWTKLKGVIKDTGDILDRIGTMTTPDKAVHYDPDAIIAAGVQASLRALPSAGGAATAGLNTGGSGMITAFNEHMEKIAQQMRESIFNIFGDAVAEGFAAAFSGKGIGGAIKSLGKTILSGLGGLFKQLGSVWLAYGATMFKWSAALWNPATSGIAALAIGAALLALGGALGAVGGGGGSAGSGGGGYGGIGYNNTSEEITRVRLMPGWAQGSSITEKSSNNYQFTVIGANDPKAQRAIADLVRNAERRGL